MEWLLVKSTHIGPEEKTEPQPYPSPDRLVSTAASRISWWNVAATSRGADRQHRRIHLWNIPGKRVCHLRMEGALVVHLPPGSQLAHSDVLSGSRCRQAVLSNQPGEPGSGQVCGIDLILASSSVFF